MDNFLMGTSYGGDYNPNAPDPKQIEQLRQVMQLEPELSVELKRAMDKYGLDMKYFLEAPEPKYYFAGPYYSSATGTLGTFGTSGGQTSSPGAAPGSSGQQSTGQSTPAQPTAVEIDTNLQIILSSIPIADPGKIITSEYHNSLRDAVRAIASRIGLSVNPVSEFKILSFAPNFLPLPPPSTTSGATPNKWDVFLNRASIPTTGLNIQQPVSGGFVVQLPDGATIFQMTVRGEKFEKDNPKPTKFTVKLNRLKFGKEKLAPTVLLSVDLSKLTEGVFEEKATIKLADDELDLDTITAQNKIADRRRVNNETHLYFVTAEWLGGANNAAKSEIHSIQIFCAV